MIILILLSNKLCFLINLENTLGVDEGLLMKLEAEVSSYKDELDSLCDSTEEQKLEVKLLKNICFKVIIVKYIAEMHYLSAITILNTKL